MKSQDFQPEILYVSPSVSQFSLSKMVTIPTCEIEFVNVYEAVHTLVISVVETLTGN